MDNACKPRPCHDPCGPGGIGTGAAPPAAERDRYRRLLQDLGLTPDQVERFLDELLDSLRERTPLTHGWPRTDILGLIAAAVAEGNLDEAVWRAFLAAHFGRASAGDDGRDAAGLLLSGFGDKPRWTWTVVSRDAERFRTWLQDEKEHLAGLRFGNHRKFESQQPDILWSVVRSFLDLVARHGGHPAAVVRVDAPGSTPETRFDVLFHRFLELTRFARTGAFDFVELLGAVGLVDASPGKCYLTGSTGPRDGARVIWPGRTDDELEELAVALARRLGVTASVLEDTLCNWQKS